MTFISKKDIRPRRSDASCRKYIMLTVVLMDHSSVPLMPEDSSDLDPS